jgi:hypothetical protein
MWLPTSIVAEVDRVARIHYVDVEATKQWNAHRQEGELRLLTGWCWTAKNGKSFRQGFKTMTVAYRDAHYTLVSNSEAPAITRPRLRVVTGRRAA